MENNTEAQHMIFVLLFGNPIEQVGSFHLSPVPINFISYLIRPRYGLRWVAFLWTESFPLFRAIQCWALSWRLIFVRAKNPSENWATRKRIRFGRKRAKRANPLAERMHSLSARINSIQTSINWKKKRFRRPKHQRDPLPSHAKLFTCREWTESRSSSISVGLSSSQRASPLPNVFWSIFASLFSHRPPLPMPRQHSLCSKAIAFSFVSRFSFLSALSTHSVHSFIDIRHRLWISVNDGPNTVFSERSFNKRSFVTERTLTGAAKLEREKRLSRSWMQPSVVFKWLNNNEMTFSNVRQCLPSCVSTLSVRSTAGHLNAFKWQISDCQRKQWGTSERLTKRPSARPEITTINIHK